MNKYWELTKALPNEANHEAVSEFLLSLKVANRSRTTIILYRGFLERFFSDIKVDFTEISSEVILEWFQRINGKVKETSLRFYLSVLASFYNFCIQEEYLKRTPIKRRWFPRLPQPIPKYLEREEIAKTRQQSEKESLRNQALLEFMLTSGCRISEVHRLNREDVDLENRTVKVVGKGKKIREVHFSEKCAILLERYITATPQNAQALFVTSTGKRLAIRTMNTIITEIGEGAGLGKGLHPHRLRHTFATELMAKGAELSFISEEMGHSSLSTTQIYVRLPKREIIALYRKYMG
ncbi:tyrosine-type recombinase/integrase [Cytobacillus oceanisediminis]|uniref:tyrosine-type recombinase/integrase n=1 Tax=Cytobacillus oceanisediminis TaxID=665099 RepID=UPI0018655FDE|nr:tyrosine-type recombinase/integrase [Cytobacillus oceanisediminis]QOK25893.1 tyrosine-type recombinase/integrase [Cytobacillus oceanisediminis]